MSDVTMLLYWISPLVIWATHVAGIALILYTDRDCKNQVGFLSGSYNGVCQSTLGTAAISFKVVDAQSGCLVTLYPAAKPVCLVTPNNFGFAQIDKCYDNSNGTIAEYSVDQCDNTPAPLLSDKTTSIALSTSPSSQNQAPAPTPSSDKATTLSRPSQTPAPAPATTSSTEQTTSTLISLVTSSPVTQTSARASSTEKTIPTEDPSSRLPTETPNSAQSSPPAPAPSPEGLTRAESIIIGTVVPIGVVIPGLLFGWWKYRRGRDKKNSGPAESSPDEGSRWS